MSHAVRVNERTVLTLALEGRDVGLLVTAPWEDGWYLEHVVVFPQAPPTALVALLEAGIEEANQRDAAFVGIFQPHTGMDPRLRDLAQRYGFVPYDEDADGVYLVKYAFTFTEAE